MCGIVGAIAQRNVTPILIEGLHRLEYRGYDSAGLAVVSGDRLDRIRAVGCVRELESALAASPLHGYLGISHTRWATHGRPTEANAHPHVSADRIAVVHNGIIENHEVLKRALQAKGYAFQSDTDTEVVAHLLDDALKSSHDLLGAFRATIQQLQGAYALGVIHRDYPDQILCAREGSPLVVGCGIDEFYIASDPLALLQVTDRFIYLDEGDLARVRRNAIEIWDRSGLPVDQLIDRPVVRYEHADQVAEKGHYRHYMLKEIHEQPMALRRTLEGKFSADGTPMVAGLGPDAEALLRRAKSVQIVACGTSYHAGLVARYWLEEFVGVPCSVEIASEFRYRAVAVRDDALLVTISQSGETADTLAALRFAKRAGYLASLAVCNVPGSSLVRESDLRLMTQAGPEIGVASTKAFTTQLVALLWLAAAMASVRGMANAGDRDRHDKLITALRAAPEQVERALALEHDIERLAARFADKHHALFLGRGSQYPVAMEGALKLKEISYIHAEAYAAGELKHGPLALVDDQMPVVTVAPSDALLEKLKSNLQEVRARGGRLINFACERAGLPYDDNIETVVLPKVPDVIAPIVFSIPLQLLAYHVALVKGTDVDRPRNLAKSVTVE